MPEEWEWTSKTELDDSNLELKESGKTETEENAA